MTAVAMNPVHPRTRQVTTAPSTQTCSRRTDGACWGESRHPLRPALFSPPAGSRRSLARPPSASIHPHTTQPLRRGGTHRDRAGGSGPSGGQGAPPRCGDECCTARPAPRVSRPTHTKPPARPPVPGSERFESSQLHAPSGPARPLQTAPAASGPAGKCPATGEKPRY